MNLGLIPYTGNKEELLPALIPLFPKPDSYERFVDCFCGGLSVSVNTDKPTISNDYNASLIEMYEAIRDLPHLNAVYDLIEKHGLNKTDREAYERFRLLYNKNRDPIHLFILILHSFSNLHRTNDEGEFNAPFGSRSINKNTNKRFSQFKRKSELITFTSGSFVDLDIKQDDFVYCDPPYLITNAVYNKFWGDGMENRLYAWLDDLNARNVRFGLSNVTHHAGKQNDILINWMQKYQVHNLDKKYVLGQHQKGFEETPSGEVYVCNYVNKVPFTLEDLM